MVDEARVLALLRAIRADLTFLGREADADLDAFVVAVLGWLETGRR